MWFTDQHPSFKQARCFMKLCNVSAGPEKFRRVTLEMSRHLFKTKSEHIPAGTGNLEISFLILIGNESIRNLQKGASVRTGAYVPVF